MTGKMRLFVGALVVFLALAPVVVRATRVFDPSGRPSIALSFKKSFDEPPQIAAIPGEIQVTPVAVAAVPIAVPAARSASTISERSIDTLRGPPARVRS